MSQLVDDLLSNVDIVDVIGRYVDFKKTGANFSGLCPFHNEKTPSFVVSPQKQIFKCFGCGKGGDAITFIKEIERIDFRDAAKLLAKDAHIDLEKYVDKKTLTHHHEYSEQKEMLKYIHKVAQEFFMKAFQENTDAQKYLYQERKITPDIAKYFQIGYAPNSYYDLITYLKSKGFSTDDILKSSLGKQNDAEMFSFFRHRILFPISDTMGNIVAYSGRVINPNDKPKYLNSSEHLAFEKSKILYGLAMAKNHIKEFDKLIVVEGQMDVVGLYRLGYPVGIASSGTSLTTAHITILKRYTPNIYFLFDNDKAGRNATIRAMKIAYQQDIFPKIITLPSKYKDVDDLANIAKGKEIMQECIDNAHDAFSVIIEYYIQQYDMTSPVEKQKFLYDVFSILVTITDIAIQDHYIELIAEKISMRYEVLSAQYKKYRVTDGKIHTKPSSSKNEKYTLDREKLFCALFFDDFIDKILQPHNYLSEYKKIVLQVGSYEINNYLHKTLNKQLTESEVGEIQQMQLRWENSLDNKIEQLEKYQFVRQFSTPVLQQYIRNILGDKHISGEEKQNILLNKRRI